MRRQCRELRVVQLPEGIIRLSRQGSYPFALLRVQPGDLRAAEMLSSATAYYNRHPQERAHYAKVVDSETRAPCPTTFGFAFVSNSNRLLRLLGTTRCFERCATKNLLILFADCF
jgi:hypothetical protein